MLICKNGLMYIKAKGLPDNILSITTTRFSGFSKENYASLNFGYHVGDSKNDVNKNYDKLKKVFNISNIITLNQIHSDKIVSENFALAPADGLYTQKVDTALGIMTADCFNVQLVGDRLIANLHCGWRSIYAGIIENCLKMFEQHKQIVKYAVIGPGICERCYDVSEDLVLKFQNILKLKDFFIRENNRFYLDLRKIINFKLENYAVNVINEAYCTKCCDFLYSYRRNNTTGRLISVVIRYE